MTLLFQRVCDTLGRIPIDDTTLKLKFQRREDKFYCIDPRDALKTPENRKKLIDALRDNGQSKKNMPEFSRIKHKASHEYRSSGWKYAEELLQHQRDKGHIFYCVIIKFGEKPLYSKKTADVAERAIKKVVGKYPAYWKIERTDARESDIHAHILMLVPENHKFNKTVNNFKILTPIRLGEKEDYKDQPLHRQVWRFIHYLLKPADARALKGKGKGLYYKEMWYEWWQNELNKKYGGKVWDVEGLNLRKALNLNITRFKDTEQQEVERWYEENCILPSLPPDLSTVQSPNNPRPIEENSTRNDTKPNIPEQFGCKDEILARRPLGGYGSGGVFAVVSELSRYFPSVPCTHEKSPEIREKPPDNRGKVVEYR